MHQMKVVHSSFHILPHSISLSYLFMGKGEGLVGLEMWLEIMFGPGRISLDLGHFY